MAPSTTSITNKSLRTILWAGLLAGILDALAAMSLFMIRGGKNPMAVWRYVASGVFGLKAMPESSGMAVWGLAFHFLIALAFAAFFFTIYPILRRLISNPVINGFLYGIVVWLIMNLVVLPLSNVAMQPFELSRVLTGMGVLMVCIGLPIALITHQYYRHTK